MVCEGQIELYLSFYSDLQDVYLESLVCTEVLFLVAMLTEFYNYYTYIFYVYI